MELNTAAAVISYISKIEQEAAQFYEKWAGVHEELRDLFLSFVAENKKNVSNIKRIYYSVVSDALETGFSFKGLQADVVIPLVGEEASYSDVLKASMDMEENIMRFYEKAAGLSKSLLADVPRAMERVSKAREKRREKLLSLLKQ